PPPLSTPDPPSYFTLLPLPPRSTLFPYTTLFRSRNEILQMAILEPEFAVLDETDSGLDIDALKVVARGVQEVRTDRPELGVLLIDRKSTRLNSSHGSISYAVFCLKKKNTTTRADT